MIPIVEPPAAGTDSVKALLGATITSSSVGPKIGSGVPQFADLNAIEFGRVVRV